LRWSISKFQKGFTLYQPEYEGKRMKLLKLFLKLWGEDIAGNRRMKLSSEDVFTLFLVIKRAEKDTPTLSFRKLAVLLHRFSA